MQHFAPASLTYLTLLLINWYQIGLTPSPAPQQWSHSRLQSWKASGHRAWWFWTERRGAWRRKLATLLKLSSCLSFETSPDLQWCGACQSGRSVRSRRCPHFCTGLSRANHWTWGPGDGRWSSRAPRIWSGVQSWCLSRCCGTRDVCGHQSSGLEWWEMHKNTELTQNTKGNTSYMSSFGQQSQENVRDYVS